MEFTIKATTPEKLTTGTLVVFSFADQLTDGAAKALDAASKQHLAALLAAEELAKKPGSLLPLPRLAGTDADRVLLVSLGSRENYNEKAWRDALAAAARALANGPADEAAVCLPRVPAERNEVWGVQQLARALGDARYSYRTTRKVEDAPAGASKICIVLAGDNGTAHDKVAERFKRAMREGAAVASGMHLARELGNLPGNHCTPEHLASIAQALGKEFDFEVNVLRRKDAAKLGMGAFLAVARGSHQPPRFIVMHYKGGKRDEAPVVLVGKGITFDSGGISLKPGSGMDEMKFDMCGAASVLGTFRAVAELKLPVNLVGLIPATENMPGGSATKPGDVVTSMSGQTIEILNTDAEGRLVLCDALSYAERFEPACVIDIATLTGACIVALGKIPSGLLGNDDALSAELVRAGQHSGDRVWPLPLWDDYQDLLKSNFADIANIGGPAAGTITAACFLARFTKAYKWAHLDIAGTAWHSGEQKGATGRPVPLLCEFLLARAAQAD